MSTVTYTVNGKTYTEKEYAEVLREKYMAHPPVGYTKKEIARMRPNDILDMHYFLNE